MNLSDEDKRLLAELCGQNGVSRDKVFKLLQTVYEFEYKEHLNDDVGTSRKNCK